MKEVKPVYYNKFRCKADRCIHSCCIGWEIDIDEETLDRYNSVQGEFAERLHSGINRDESCFILDGNERCPFLNEKGLCDIIINLGESSLCRICAEHPRFRNFFSQRTEVGLGLCCEEAAKIILTDEEPFSFTQEPQEGDESEKEFFLKRKALFDLAEDRSCTLEQRMEKILLFAGAEIPVLTDGYIFKTLSSLEILDKKWKEVISMPKYGACTVENSEKVFERLLVYFIFRHTADSLYDGMFAERTGFCVMCVKLLQRLCAGCADISEITETARMFSSEIEYSYDNTQTLIGECSCK
ncbi:MAG: flagellin lysine-N-methylase [Clostridia bacterium]|nr:flagellin lysine-N-methylase [Clostridia bacterium]